MPILDIQLVLREGDAPQGGLADAIANAAGAIFHSPPGRVWVRLSVLPAGNYAENEVLPADLLHPVFVTVLHSLLPESSALAAEAKALALSVAEIVGCSADLVHIEYMPQGRGRVAFGGNLVQ